MMIQMIAARQFSSKIASRVRNPQIAPVAVKRCTLQARVFLRSRGSLSNIATSILGSIPIIINAKAWQVPRLSILLFDQPNFHFFAFEPIFDGGGALWRTPKR